MAIWKVISRFFKVFLESEEIIIGSLESEKNGSLDAEKWVHVRYTWHFPLKKTVISINENEGRTQGLIWGGPQGTCSWSDWNWII